MALNQPVTWDSPDVHIFLGGVEQYTYNLTTGITYTVQITVHNSSRLKPANGTSVDVRWIEFGAGGQTRHHINTLTANVPVWPGTAVVSTPWRTPDVPGHYCIEIELYHPNDGNPANNRGWNNTQVYAAHSAVERPIRIFNRYPKGCPPVLEGGGPILRPHRVFLGWGVLGAVLSGLFLRNLGPHSWPTLARIGLALAGGYLVLAVIGLLAESTYAWIKRSRGRIAAEAKRSRDEERRRGIPCNLVEIEVDSYTFEDQLGKNFDPDVGFRGKGPVWPARVEPSSFLFLEGEAYRDVKFVGPGDANAGKHRVLGWVLGGATLGGVLAYFNAAGIAGFAAGGTVGLLGLGIIAFGALAGAELGFAIGFAVNWFDRLFAQSPSPITLAGCVLCAGKNTGFPPWNDNDWTFNLGGPSLAVVAPLDAGLTVDEVRSRDAPGDGPAFPVVDAGSGQQALHSEIGSHIGDYAAVGGAVGSVAGAVAGAIAGAVICAALALATFGIGGLLCALIVAFAIAVGAAVGYFAGDTIGALAGYIADKLDDFDDRGEAIHRGCLMVFSGRWVTDSSHQHNEIHNIDSAQLIECNQCDSAPTSSSQGLTAAVGIGRHPTGRDP